MDNQAVVIPENIDAIRAFAGGITASDSIRLTEEMLEVRHDFLRSKD